MSWRHIRNQAGRTRQGGFVLATAALAGVLGVLVAAGVAVAAGGGSTCQQYNPQTCNVITPPTSTVPAPATPPATVTAPTTTTTPRTTAAAPTPSTPTTPTLNSTAPTTLVTPAVTPTTAQTQSSLPFTGLDLGLVVGAGLLLLGGGLVMRRMSRRVN